MLFLFVVLWNFEKRGEKGEYLNLNIGEYKFRDNFFLMGKLFGLDGLGVEFLGWDVLVYKM